MVLQAPFVRYEPKNVVANRCQRKEGGEESRRHLPRTGLPVLILQLLLRALSLLPLLPLQQAAPRITYSE